MADSIAQVLQMAPGAPVVLPGPAEWWVDTETVPAAMRLRVASAVAEAAAVATAVAVAVAIPAAKGVGSRAVGDRSTPGPTKRCLPASGWDRVRC